MLVLISAFTSFPEAAQYHYPMLPGGWLVSNKLDSAGKIATVEAPVLVVHGGADRVVPFWMVSAVERAKGPKRFLFLDDHPHADPMKPEYFRRGAGLLEETRR